MDEYSGSKEKQKLQQALKNSIKKVTDTYKKYRPPYSEEQSSFAVKFKKPPIPTNKGKYDGPGHPKVKTLNFEPAPLANKEFIEQNRRKKEPCNCTIT